MGIFSSTPTETQAEKELRVAKRRDETIRAIFPSDLDSYQNMGNNWIQWTRTSDNNVYLSHVSNMSVATVYGEYGANEYTFTDTVIIGIRKGLEK